jgi:hypothetical protein
MQQKQEATLSDILFKINQITKIKDTLIATNVFRPDLSLFDQGTSLFGSLKVNEYSNINSFNSEILTNQQQCVEWLKVCELSPSDKWSV